MIASRAVLLSDVAYVGRVWRGDRSMGPQERKLLRHMIDRGSTRLDEAVDMLWGDCEDGGPLGAKRCVWSLMHYIRQRLRPGWSLVNCYRQEWHLVELTEMDMAA